MELCEDCNKRAKELGVSQEPVRDKIFKTLNDSLLSGFDIDDFLSELYKIETIKIR